MKIYVVGLEMVHDIVEIVVILICLSGTEERCLHKEHRLTTQLNIPSTVTIKPRVSRSGWGLLHNAALVSQ